MVKQSPKNKTEKPPGPPLAVMRVHTPEEALLVLPKEYVDLRRPHVKLAGMPFDEKLRFFEAFLFSKIGFDQYDRVTRSPYPRSLKLQLQFKDALVDVKIMGGTAEWSQIHEGDRFSFVSRLTQGYMGNPRFKSIEMMSSTGRAKAVYAGIGGKISGEVIEREVFGAACNPLHVRGAARLIQENVLVSSIIRDAGYPSAETMIFDLHRPMTPEHGKKALHTARMVCIEQVRSFSKIPANTNTAPFINLDASLKARAAAQKEKLSPGQSSALNVIRRNINGRHASRTLVNGDVGSGKTIVFLLAAASCADQGQRVSIMVPNELVARQVFKQCQQRFPDLQPALIVAGYEQPTEASRLLVGTQALLHAKNLGPIGLLVVDEQHKFSVAQRTELTDENTHIIEASATPIPRSLALALFDGWVEAKIAGVPVDKTIRSFLYEKSERAHVVEAIRQAIERGEKVIFLYASVGGGDSSCIKAAERLEEHFPGKVCLVHGKLKSDKKEAVMQSFRDGEFPILVASTVIEVGMDVPGITVMVVNQADRFGVAQLHQIRGRLVRNGGVGDFFMLTDKAVAKDTLERLTAVRDNIDGFVLAERDLEIRGFGEILGESQSGATETFFKLPRLQPADFVRR